MTISRILVVLRARRRMVLTMFGSVVAFALLVSLLFPNLYQASSSLVLNYKGIDPVSGTAMSPQLMPGYMATQIDIIRSKNVALKVVDQLKLAEMSSYKKDFQEATEGAGDIRDWIAEKLLRKVRVVPSRDSSVLDITYKSFNAPLAVDIVNAFAAQYLQTVIQLNTDPLKQVSSYFIAQIKTLRENMETARNKLSVYQQQKGIVDIDNRLDVEGTRLNDLSSQLAQVQGQMFDATARRREAQGAGGAEIPEVMSSLLIQNLKVSLAQAEAKFADLSQKLASAHPQYRASKAEVEKLRAELERQIKAMTNSVSSNARAFEQRKRDLREAVAKQKEKVLDLNRARDQLAVLAKDAESAQRAYDNAVQRFNQTSLEGHANQADVAVLNPATVPNEPWFPRLPLNMAISVFLGLALGIGLALAAEKTGRRIRSGDDLAEALSAPVLAEFDWEGPRMLPATMQQLIPAR